MHNRINKKSRKTEMASYFLYGFHSVVEAIANKNRKKLELWVTRNAYNKLISKVILPKIPINYLEKNS